MLALDFEPMIQEIKQVGRPPRDREDSEIPADVQEILGDLYDGVDDLIGQETTAILGKIVGVSGRSVAKARMIKRENPNAAAEVRSGSRSLSGAEAAVKHTKKWREGRALQNKFRKSNLLEFAYHLTRFEEVLRYQTRRKFEGLTDDLARDLVLRFSILVADMEELVSEFKAKHGA